MWILVFIFHVFFLCFYLNYSVRRKWRVCVLFSGALSHLISLRARGLKWVLCRHWWRLLLQCCNTCCDWTPHRLYSPSTTMLATHCTHSVVPGAAVLTAVGYLLLDTCFWRACGYLPDTFGQLRLPFGYIFTIFPLDYFGFWEFTWLFLVFSLSLSVLFLSIFLLFSGFHRPSSATKLLR